MNNFSKLALVATMALSAAACTKQTEPRADYFPADGVIRVATDVNQPQTRAGVTSDNITDFFMFVKNEDLTAGPRYTYFAKMKKVGDEWKSYVPTTDGTATDELTMLWQNKTTPVKVTAFRFPGNPTLVSEVGDLDCLLSVQEDQSTPEGIQKSDILYMSEKTINPATDLTPGGKIAVQLGHFFSKLNLTILLGTDFNQSADGAMSGTTTNIIESVRICGTDTEIEWVLGDPVLGDQLLKYREVTPFHTDYTAGIGTTQNAKAKYECILIPQEIEEHADEDFEVKIRVKGKTYSWKHTAAITFTSNTQYNLTLNVGKDIVNLGSLSIAPWDNQVEESLETE